jgi:tetratricopeptide (TPR) repeat protein
MAEREFPEADRRARHAIKLFQQIGDRRSEAEAVHRLGLIEMQRGNLDSARELFEQSLLLDRQAGERKFFRGEYERHVGFVLLMQGDTESAIPYFKRSLELRREVGAIDASQFAASTLASSLVSAGRLDEAWPFVAYAMMVAQRIDSPVGMAQIGLVQGRLHAKAGDKQGRRQTCRTACVRDDDRRREVGGLFLHGGTSEQRAGRPMNSWLSCRST